MSDAMALFTTDVPRITAGQAQDFTRSRYGLDGDILPLPGERDANFQLVTAERGCYMLKFINPAEPAEVRDFQTQLLLHLAQQDPTLPIPRVAPDCQGDVSPVLHTASHPFHARLISWSDGLPLYRIEKNTRLATNLGTTLARLDLALRSFAHPAAERELLWDITRMHRAYDWLDNISNPRQRELVNVWLNRWEHTVAPQLSNLRTQTIHNDFNPHNVLADPAQDMRVCGIIDFGDALCAPLINELATALAYQIGDTAQPLAWILPFVAAYHAVLPLTEQEIRLLPCLIAARLILTISITQWRSGLYPENRDYICRNLNAAWLSLQYLSRLPLDEFINQLLLACHKEPAS
ncbi:phosphotransferase [Musicola paradisiaca]|uniref:Hydroxylysine kinase n=1 Tax=Musicola paradisiaca (strain Ech703) TaxID=579405 RepID=C6CD34_MUSP7|nr:phosphotransferase [Musicola paradisiaca]ACS85075.1 aminoglycoside phosphotransferase [Musicola paradisiaca Ech703]